MEEAELEEIETDIPHFIAHVPVPSQKDVCIKSIMVSLRENLIFLHAYNKDADQPAHPPSLISTFIIPSL